MRRAALALLGWLFLAAASGPAGARQPVVVELFTSQGCSSCVAADKLVDELSKRPGVLPLTLAVDYWDYLGWNDTFARPEFTARQRAYMTALASREVYTPQVIVDGKAQTAGADKARIDALIIKARREKTAPPPIRLTPHRVVVGPGKAPAGGAEVWLVRYDPAAQLIAVKRGENRGQTLVQRNVVRGLVRLGPWTGRRRTYVLPAADDGKSLRTCIIVQGAKGGRILGVLMR